jgi:hypothetical protein
MGELSLEHLSVYKSVASTEERKLESLNKNEMQKLILERKKLNLKKVRMDRQKLKEDKEEGVMIFSMDLTVQDSISAKGYFGMLKTSCRLTDNKYKYDTSSQNA